MKISATLENQFGYSATMELPIYKEELELELYDLDYDLLELEFSIDDFEIIDIKSREIDEFLKKDKIEKTHFMDNINIKTLNDLALNNDLNILNFDKVQNGSLPELNGVIEIRADTEVIKFPMNSIELEEFKSKDISIDAYKSLIPNLITNNSFKKNIKELNELSEKFYNLDLTDKHKFLMLNEVFNKEEEITRALDMFDKIPKYKFYSINSYIIDIGMEYAYEMNINKDMEKYLDYGLIGENILEKESKIFETKWGYFRNMENKLILNPDSRNIDNQFYSIKNNHTNIINLLVKVNGQKDILSFPLENNELDNILENDEIIIIDKKSKIDIPISYTDTNKTELEAINKFCKEAYKLNDYKIYMLNKLIIANENEPLYEGAEDWSNTFIDKMTFNTYLAMNIENYKLYPIDTVNRELAKEYLLQEKVPKIEISYFDLEELGKELIEKNDLIKTNNEYIRYTEGDIILENNVSMKFKM